MALGTKLKVAARLLGFLGGMIGHALAASAKECSSWESAQFWQPNEQAGILKRLFQGHGGERADRLPDEALQAFFTCLDAIPDINMQSENGFTPLAVASESARHADVIRMVLDAGANVHQPNADGTQPLHHAVAFNPNPRIARVLIEHGADPHVETADGSSLLHLAAHHGQSIKMIDFLISLGLDPNKKDTFGLTPLHYAAKFVGNSKIVAHWSNLTTDIDDRNNLGWTPLHFAAFYNNPNVAKVLLEHGADPNAETFDTFATPAHVAAVGTRYPQMFTVLAQHGADMNYLPDTEGKDFTPLILMVSNEEPRPVHLVEALIEAGASPWKTDEQGMTPVDAAMVSNAPTVTLELLNVAQKEQSAALQDDCSQVAGAEARLACYDAVSSNEVAGASNGMSQNMSWHIEREENALTDLTDIYLSVSADETMQCGYERVRPVLYLRCMDNTTAALLVTKCFMSDIQGYGKVDYRVDQRRMQTRYFSESTDNMALGLFSWQSSMPFIRDLMDGSKLIAQFTPYNDSPKQVSFDISGVNHALRPLRQACGW